MPSQLIEHRAIIANGASASASFRLHHGKISGIKVPTPWTATAIELHFEVTDSPFSVADGSATWVRLRDQAGADIALTGIVAGAAIQLSTVIGPWPRIRIVGTDAADAGVNQAAERTLLVEVQEIGNG